MKMIGKKFGTNPILTYKRGGQCSPLFLFSISFLFLFQYGYSQSYSTKLFPDVISYNGLLDTTLSYSMTGFYDHTYKHTVNDTTITQSYKSFLHHRFSFPFYYNSNLMVEYRNIDNHSNYKDELQKQHLYTTQQYHVLRLGYRSIQKWFNLQSHYSYAIDYPFKDFNLSFALKYKGLFIQPEYFSLVKSSSGYFIADKMSYKIMNFKKFDSHGIMLGYHGKRGSLEIKKITKYPSTDIKHNPKGLGLNMGANSVQYNSRLIYNFHKCSVWSKLHFNQDTSDVPIYWEDRKIGEFTAIDDTLFSILFGIDIQPHQIAIGTGNWSGKVWVSQFSPHPFANVWAILSGTKYYLDTRLNIDFINLSYEYKWQYNEWESDFSLNYLNFEGSIFGEQWAIIFPFITAVHDRIEIQIEKLDIIEANIGLTKILSNKMKINLWSNILLPIDLEITVTPTILEPSDPEPSDPIVDESISGGMQFGATISYLFQ
tara:strand:- start:1094 stop:2545 length:1452 start_codon:yes stop_codon:yes gene_type:complete